ncbi:DUF389 domain-containing protein [Winogradskyella sp. SYSU M77433]|uniref:DUF389 domain-containing protein n=1 Tax=Winogradskyella sp. SYSU M77433 TaxID=3042722 RepID=UPI00247FFDB3|nr:DUF389 domain-containing protein [Winogradskyella sp. SYSU M77433]MDH7914586.1 DUF389 domain-containing protein [Winogradskyella sp. SYSU M77433]|tara:strand:- start:304 stop:1788 length:1485 start_codon:yes stop_codon:yes gene_type:complete
MEENKFNFSEDENSQMTNEMNKENTVEEKKEAVKKDAQGLFTSVKTFLSELLDFREDTDRDATIAAIKADIPFKGATAWILVCSIFVASIGLNANSTAVVIGAMLISPLMGPILGVGLSIAINDIDTLKRSLINLAIMIGLSLLTAFLFFRFFPLSEDTSELLGRVKPDIRDVLIAFFGGLALIIARTKKGTIASVIFGVAIATALMPPLCTAGYGLAKANWEYFGQAMYLFTINTIFIALATFLVLKILRFPMLKYANSKKRKRIARLASLIAIIVMIPASFTFFDVYRESTFNRDASRFIDEELGALPHAEYIKNNAYPEYSHDSISTITLNTFGLDEIPESTERVLQSRMTNYSSLKNAKLIVNQNRLKNLDNLRYMEELRSRDSLDLMSQQQKITYLESKLKGLSRLEKDQIPFGELIKELKINYEKLESISYANEVTSNMKSIDTMKVFSVKWIDSVSTVESKASDTKKLRLFLKERLDLDTLNVIVRN